MIGEERGSLLVRAEVAAEEEDCVVEEYKETVARRRPFELFPCSVMPQKFLVWIPLFSGSPTVAKIIGGCEKFFCPGEKFIQFQYWLFSVSDSIFTLQ